MISSYVPVQKISAIEEYGLANWNPFCIHLTLSLNIKATKIIHFLSLLHHRVHSLVLYNSPHKASTALIKSIKANKNNSTYLHQKLCFYAVSKYMVLLSVFIIQSKCITLWLGYSNKVGSIITQDNTASFYPSDYRTF